MDYISPWGDMWPWFHVKFFAVRTGATWRLLYGQWVARVTTIDLPGDTNGGPLAHSIFVQTLIPRQRGLRMLRELAQSGTCTWEFKTGALTIELPSTPGSSGGYIDLAYARQGYRVFNNELNDVAEKVPWRLFSGTVFAPWVSGTRDVEWEKTLAEVAAEHGVESVGQLDEQMIGRGEGRCVLLFDFPLGLQIARQSTNVEESISSWTVACQKPLTFHTVTLRKSTSNIYSPASPELSIDVRQSTIDGWGESGSIEIQHPCTRLFADIQVLGHTERLSLNVEEPGKIQILTNVVARMYAQQLDSDSVIEGSLIKKGKDQWRKHLFEGDDAKFEVAVANLLARFQYHVLFGGKVLNTPGIDLVVIHPYAQKVVLISCKGGKGKNLTSYADWAILGQTIAAYQKLMPGWSVNAIVATHLPQHEVDALPVRGFLLQKWGEPHLVQLFNATIPSEVENLLWPISKSNYYHYDSDDL